jgi:hypothetical protein
VKVVQKIDEKAKVPDPKIVKENDNYVVIKEEHDSELMKILLEDDPIIEIPKDLSFSERKITKEERMEELTCHGDAMDELKDSVEDTMVGRDMSLKNKILRDREDLSFSEKKHYKHFSNQMSM